eukprot:TRINITY_DN431_c0_g1_i14.p1 TRINITY_DN431_c0_g1~~TRINITY_DN431_c0_g1_i14.p1  ORF type:complete len:283 (+),score=65.27 TRINITY_DN431_c0_g1_i14:62-850(+)
MLQNQQCTPLLLLCIAVLGDALDLTLLPCPSPVQVAAFSDVKDFDERNPITFGGEIYMSATVLVWRNGFYSRIIDFGNGMASDNLLVAQRDGTGMLTPEVHRDGLRTNIDGCPTPLNKEFFLEITIARAGTHAPAGLAVVYIDGKECSRGTITLPRWVSRNSNLVGKSNWPADVDLDGYVKDFTLSYCLPPVTLPAVTVPLPCTDAVEDVSFAKKDFFTETSPLEFGGQVVVRTAVTLNTFAAYTRVMDFGNGNPSAVHRCC